MTPDRKLIIIAHDIRSAHNVGSILRTCEGLGIEKVYLSGYTPFPLQKHDSRLPHLAEKIHRQIQKTALDSEKLVDWEYVSSPQDILNKYKNQGYEIVGLEQSANSVILPNYQPTNKTVLILGREVEGISEDILKLCQTVLEIPMTGKKESYNVVQAMAIASYTVLFER